MYLTNMTNPRLTLNKQNKKKGEGGGIWPFNKDENPHFDIE